MASAVDVTLGTANVVVPLALLLTALVLVLRLSARGELRRGILYVVFLPERQKALTRVFVLTVAFFLAGGLFAGLTLLGGLPEPVSDLTISLSDIGASVGLFLLLTRGLAPRHLSTGERVQLDAQPIALAALATSGPASERH
ncbi:MAG TPA: hypothetical protein VJQ43_02580 [Thermoplasmata archaeon]|nr:hypothetical protein [Thermoplasmata archaeon]